MKPLRRGQYLDPDEPAVVVTVQVDVGVDRYGRGHGWLRGVRRLQPDVRGIHLSVEREPENLLVAHVHTT